MDEFILKIRHEILDHNLISPREGSRYDVIATLSGGADSTALLAALNMLGFKCLAAHCNFHLRGEESDRDMNFAEATARKYASGFKVIHFDVEKYKKAHGISTEMACRELRYEWFRQISKESGDIPVALAHHSDDNEETFFLNALRGTGIAGLCGMSRRNGIFIRPLLHASRKEITDFLKRHSIGFVNDSTNFINDVKRNKLRNIILPTIREQFPYADSGILRTIADLNRNRSLYDEAVGKLAEKYANGDVIDIKSLAEEIRNPETLLYEIIRSHGFTFTQACDIIHSRNESGRKFPAGDKMALLNRGSLIITEANGTDAEATETNFHITLNGAELPGNLTAEIIAPDQMKPDRSGNTIYLDASVLADSPTFTLRNWREGDRLKPFGMRGSRLVSDIISDAKLSLTQKREIMTLSVNGEIIWVIGLRASRHYPVTQDTEEILRISLQKSHISQ